MDVALSLGAIFILWVLPFLGGYQLGKRKTMIINHYVTVTNKPEKELVIHFHTNGEAMEARAEED